MSWVFAVIGALLGGGLAAVGDVGAWFGMLVGASMGALLGNNFALRARLRELQGRLDALTEHFERVTRDIHQRFLRLEAGAEPAGTRAAPSADLQGEAAAPLPTEPGLSTASPGRESEPIPQPPAPAEEARPVAQAESAAASAPVLAPTPQPVSVSAAEAATEAANESASASEATSEAATPAETAIAAQVAATAPAPRRRAPAPVDSGPGLLARAWQAGREWLFGGNTIVRVGVLLLFLGLAFLLRYAAERAVLPIEFRYIGAGVAALALLWIGWRTRERNAAYGLLLQGAAVAVLYLTLFAAMRLHALLPLPVGFVLLVLVAALAALLAILQDARGLAIAGTLGGFAAPILASSGGGSHIALFSYFLLLNTGVLSVAWFKSWRVLNLVGFIGSLGIGLAWGLRSYQPQHLFSCQAFLLVFFLMYVGIALRFARHRLRQWAHDLPELERGALLRDALAHANAIDGSLIFGVPLAAFAIQLGLVRDIEFASAFSALGFGAFYLGLARLVFERERQRYLLLVEVFLALGVVFATLAIPLALEARWTAAAWALEGAGIYWVGLRQQRVLARNFALLLELGALLYFAADLHAPAAAASALLGGSWLGALLLAAAWLSNWWVTRAAVQAHQVPQAPQAAVSARLSAGFASIGLACAYLVAPLLLGAHATALAWALAGLATLWCGLHWRDGAWLACGMLVQLAAGVLFFAYSHAGGEGGQIFAAGGEGLLVCGLVGFSALASAVLAQRQASAFPRVATASAVLLLFALSLINIAVLFVLPWRHAAAVWAGSSLLIVWLALGLRQRLALAFGLVLQIAAALAFFAQRAPAPGPGELAPFTHTGFAVPLALAVAAYLMSWRLQRRGMALLGTELALLIRASLLWASLWWAYAWSVELLRVLPQVQALHALLACLALSVMLATLAARRWLWPELARQCMALLPLAALMLGLALLGRHYRPWADYGALAWLLVLAAHGLALWRLAREPMALWAPAQARWLHAGGVWLALLLAALCLRRVFAAWGDEASAWAWLGWAIAPVLYLLLVLRRRVSDFWPLSEDPVAYRNWAALPVIMLLLLWVLLANFGSTASAQPLPYLPLLNPLELAFGLVLLAATLWWRDCGDEMPQGMAHWLPLWLAAVGFVSYTCGVARAVHHLAGVPFAATAMRASMVFQAGLSLAWSVAALVLMASGHRRGWRLPWLCGAVLVAVVVIKLFVVELSDSGGLERIVSFIGVGVLLLVVGYFAPLPPRQEERERQ